MRIRKLTLKNIGAYYSEHTIHFNVSEEKNVVLIGGKNGAGKTTLLESIRIALYGPLAYGYKSGSAGYQKRIHALLNKTALESNESQFQVFLEFEYVEGLQKNIYTFKRQWDPYGHQIKESFSIFKDNLHISDPKETDVIQTKINHSFPPRLMELCFFDGETISRVITDDLISDYLKESSHVLFNIELFTYLLKDIELYKKQIIGQFDPELQQQYEKVSEEINGYQSSKAKLIERIGNLKQEIEDHEIEINELKKQFEIYGGLIQEERASLISEMNTLEQERKLLSDKIRAFVTGLFPLYIVREQIESIRQQMEAEEQYEIHSFLSKNITPKQIEGIFKQINLLNKPSTEDSLGKLFLGNFLDLIKPDTEKPIYRASFSQRNQLEMIFSEIKKIDSEQIINWFMKSNELLSEIQQLRKKLETNDTNNEFQHITKQIQNLTTHITEKSTLIIQLEKELESNEDLLTEKRKEQELFERQLSDVSKVSTTIQNIERVSEISKEFVRIQLEEKALDIQREALWMFKQLLRKDNFIDEIQICPKNFEISLMLNNGSTIDKGVLSAGEKQILLLSLIWALIKVSNRKIPFVFDTLLGRLDSSHKANVLSKYIPQCGEQVIILSTDSEIDDVHFGVIKPYVSNIATIVHDPQTQTSKFGVGQYFDTKIYEEGIV